MAPRDRSTATDVPQSLRLRSAEIPRRRLLNYGGVSAVSKQSVLGLLALLVGAGAAMTPDGLLIGVPLLIAASYLLVRSLLAAGRAR